MSSSWDSCMHYILIFLLLILLAFFSYMVAKASRQNSGGGDGIEMIKNEPFEKDGSKGQYTFKVCFAISLNIR